MNPSPNMKSNKRQGKTNNNNNKKKKKPNQTKNHAAHTMDKASSLLCI
jgi:hypothetical protein